MPTANKRSSRKPKGIRRRLGSFLMDQGTEGSNTALAAGNYGGLRWRFNGVVWDLGYKLYYKKAAD